jgi:hypothetical protein
MNFYFKTFYQSYRNSKWDNNCANEACKGLAVFKLLRLLIFENKMIDRDSLSRYQKDDEVIWLWNYVGNARIKIGYKIKTLLHYEQSPF